MEQTAIAQNTTEAGDLGDIDVTDQVDRESRGLTLAFSTWHRLLRTLLIVEVPLLAMFGFFREVDASTWLPLVAVPAILVGASSAVGSERFRAGLVSLGFVWCSWLLVLWSGGATEAHFHLLIVIGLIGLYRDSWALGLAFVGMILLHMGVGLVDPALIYNSPAAIQSPLVWGFIHSVAIIGAAAVPIFTWRGTREAEDDSAERAAEEVAERAEELRQREVAAVYATVARRSQTLLERQLDLIEKLEQDEKDPDTLQDLFSLDHLATRMNREAASMLVLAGGEPNRRVIGRPPLSEVARGAVGEIEDYTRVDVVLADDRPVVGRVVAPLVHLLSELIENAASYSPPTSRVEVIGATAADGSYTMQIRDRGIGLDDAKLAQYNHLLSHPQNTSPPDSQRLGLDVVARLAGRHGLPVQLSVNTDGPGVTATVSIPGGLLGQAGEATLATAPPAADLPMPSRVELAAPIAVAPQAARERVAAGPAGMTEPALPTVEPAPPVPVGAAAGSPFAPAWAQATGRGAATSTPAPAHEAKVRQPVGAGVSGGAEGPRMGSTVPSWSYAGHLGGEDVAEARPKRRLFGRRKHAAEDVPVEPVIHETPLPAAVDAPIPANREPRGDFGSGDDLDALLSASRISQTGPPAGSAPIATPASPGADAQARSRAEVAASLLDDLPGMGNQGDSQTPPSAARPARQAPPVQMPSSRAGQGPTLPGRHPSEPARSDADQTAAPRPPVPATAGEGAGDRSQNLFTPDAKPAADKTAAARKAAEQTAADRMAADRMAAERKAADRMAAERMAAEREAAEQVAAERRAQQAAAAAAPSAQVVESAPSEDSPPPEALPVRGRRLMPRRSEAGRPEAGRSIDDIAAGATPPASDGEPASEPAASPAPVAAASETVTPTAGSTSEIGSPLPQRRRGASLPAPLLSPAEGEAASSAAAAPVSREQSRSLLSSYQSRLQAGRKAAEEQVSQSDSSGNDDTTPAG